MPKTVCQGTGPTAEDPRRDALKGCKNKAWTTRKTWRWGKVEEGGKKSMEVFYVHLCPGHADKWDELKEARQREVKRQNHVKPIG